MADDGVDCQVHLPGWSAVLGPKQLPILFWGAPKAPLRGSIGATIIEAIIRKGPYIRAVGWFQGRSLRLCLERGVVEVPGVIEICRPVCVVQP